MEPLTSSPINISKIQDHNSIIKMVAIFFVFISFLYIYSPSEAQVISHELRRLAVSTNQFGIDALRALDRIEPPDKVLVLCPVCLSSSLAMIMMGSSKYQVVTPLRHALYVWSMKPSEINKGFRDIFNHIGLNQNIKQPNGPRQSRVIGKQNQDEHYSLLDSAARLSLPELIKHLEKNNHPNWQKSKSIMSNSTFKTIKLKNELLAQPHDLSQIRAITNVYIQRGLVMNYQYSFMLRQFYNTFVHPVDFVRSGEETRQHINSLVSSNTEGKISDIIKRGSTETTNKIMIVSAFHFRGTLDIRLADMAEINPAIQELNNRSTLALGQRNHRSLPSEHIDQGQKVKDQNRRSYIETQKSLLKFGHFPALECSVIEIPFNNRLVSLIILMPNHLNSTEILLTKLSAKVLSDMINSLTVKRISVEIPVIKFDRGPVNVDGLLQELNLKGLFFADKPHIMENGLNRWMRASDIVHETSIDIGTLNPRWDEIEDRLKVGAHDNSAMKANEQIKFNSSLGTRDDHIRLDKPFFYFVFDSINGLVLTMGRIRD